MPVTVLEQFRFEADSVRGSKFLVTVAPATTDSQARETLASCRQNFPDASHHCSAWRIATPNTERASDDGEPGGSAGRPMLAQLAGRDAVDIVAVVCRWFGGTKLGVGGLVRAYGGSLRDALDAAPLQPWEQTIDVIISHRHGSSNAIEQVLARFGAKSTSSSFGSGVERHVVVARDRLAALRLAVADASSGTARISLADDQSSRDQSSRTDW